MIKRPLLSRERALPPVLQPLLSLASSASRSEGHRLTRGGNEGLARYFHVRAENKACYSSRGEARNVYEALYLRNSTTVHLTQQPTLRKFGSQARYAIPWARYLTKNIVQSCFWQISFLVNLTTILKCKVYHLALVVSLSKKRICSMHLVMVLSNLPPGAIMKVYLVYI